MAQFDNWPMFQDFSFQEFRFPVDRYKEWEAGRLVASGDVHFNIYFKYNSGGFFSQNVCIDVQLENNPMSRKIISTIKFDRATANGDRILFYVAAEQTNVQHTALAMLSSLLGYTRSKKYYDSKWTQATQMLMVLAGSAKKAKEEKPAEEKPEDNKPEEKKEEK